jgi:tetratricopeptide (TPR) repeat protein
LSVPASSPDANTPLRGYCTPPALAELIRDLYLDEKTGTLVLSRSGVEKALFLDRGMILTVSSTHEDERLADFLARRGAVRPEEAEALKGLDDRQAAEALLKRGALTPAALQDGSRELSLQVLTGLFRWDDLEYRFLEGPVAGGPLETNVVVSFELIIRALRSMNGFEQIKESLVRQDRALRFSDQLYLPFDQLRLTPVEGFLISRIDGQSKVRDILAQVPPGEEEATTRFLFGLLILGLANFVPAIGSGPLSCRDLVRGEEEKRRREERERGEILEFYKLVHEGTPHQVLELETGAAADQVKAHYQERKERYQPGRFLRKVQQELKEELQIIEARLLEAFLAVRSESLATKQAGGGTERLVSLDLESLSKRKELTKTQAQSVEEERNRMAEQFFAKARDYWKMGDFFNCIRYCEFAAGNSDKSAGVYSLLGQALARNPDYRWQKRAENALVRAAELEPFNPAHNMALGDFYRAHNLHAKARKQYEKAIQILPTHAEAMQALKELDRERR